MLELFGRAKAGGVEVDVVSMTTVLNAYAKEGDWKTVLLMLERMEGEVDQAGRQGGRTGYACVSSLEECWRKVAQQHGRQAEALTDAAW